MSQSHSNAESTTAGRQAEHEVGPTAVLVHDPAAAGSFEQFGGCPNSESTGQKLLFREHPDTATYAKQYWAFVDLLATHVPKVIHLGEVLRNRSEYTPAKINPNQVFTRDSIITLPWQPDAYITCRMKRPLRQLEPATMAAAARELGLQQILEIPSPLVLEGGDVIPFSREERRTLLVGVGRRTGRDTLDFLRETLMPEFVDEIVGIELAGWRMNLDGGLVPVTDDIVVADTQSITGSLLLDRYGTREIDVLGMLRDLGMQILDVTPQESVYGQACNCVCLGGRKAVFYDLNQRVLDLLVDHSVEVIQTPGSELVKGRGGPRCMTRPLYVAGLE